MSTLPIEARDESGIPEDIPYLELADSSRSWMAPHYVDQSVNQPIPFDRMLAAERDDNRSQELRSQEKST